MKIPGATLPMNTPSPRGDRAGANARTWLAELEKAWLEGWQNQPSSADRHQQVRAESQRPDANSSKPSDANDLPTPREQASPGERPSDRAQEPASGSDAPSRQSLPPMQFASTALALNARGPQAVVTQARAQQTDEPGGPAAERGASRSAVEWQAPAATPTLPQHLSAVRPQAHAVSESAPREGIAQEVPQASFDAHSARSAPLAKTMIHVAVNDSTAQVTLRDAQLSGEQAVITSRMLASQLFSTGMQSVRVYVNGVETLHRPDAGPAGDLPSSRAGTGADLPSIPSLLERN